MKKIIVYFDGGTYKKRVAIVDVNCGYKIRVWENLKSKTNNEFEFLALAKALDYVYSEYGSNAKNVILYGDSQLVINGIKNDSQFSTRNLKKFEKMTREKLRKFNTAPTLNWITREENLAGFILDMLYSKRKRLDKILR